MKEQDENLLGEQEADAPGKRQRRLEGLLSKLQRYKRLFLQRWWVPFLGMLIGLAFVSVKIFWFTPPVFTSYGRMIISSKLAIAEGSLYTEEYGNFMGTQSELMQSGIVQSRAKTRVTTQKPDITPCVVNLLVTAQPRTSIFLLSGSSSDQRADPQYIQAYLQACMEEYINLKKEMRSQVSDTTLAGLTEEVMRLERELRKCDEELAAFQATNSIVVLQEQGNSVGLQLATLKQQLAPLKSEFELLKALTPEQNYELNRERAVGASSGDPEDITLSDPEFVRGAQQILQLKAEMKEMSQFLRPAHPKMVAMAEDASRRERLLEYYRQSATEQAKKQYDRGLENSKKQMERKKNSLSAQILKLEKEVDEWEGKTMEISRAMGEYQKIKSKATRIQGLYDKLLSTMQTVDVNKGLNPENVTILESASGAMSRRPEILQKLSSAAILGIVAALALLVLLNQLDDRMNSLTELKEMFEETVLAQIPMEKSQNRSKDLSLLHMEDDRHAFAEAYRSLRSSLFYMGGKDAKRPRLMLITSSIPNEGKSMTAANLAIILSQTGSKVLLIDADLRKGVQHGRFGIEGHPGLTEALTEKKEWRPMVRETKYDNLWILPRGAAVHSSSELFIGSVVEKLFSDALQTYEYVLVDSAPVMAADDVTSLAPHVDGLIFVVRAEMTSARIARAALDLLEQRHSNILGVVFNAVRATSSDYYYYYKYRDYYNHPKKSGKSGSEGGKHTSSHKGAKGAAKEAAPDGSAPAKEREPMTTTKPD